MTKPLFTVDWEAWHDALHLGYKDWDRILEPTLYLLDLLKRHKVKAIFYVLESTKNRNFAIYKAIVNDGHVIKTHGVYHYRWEKADRKPYAWLGFTGGFYFRFLPYWFVKWCVELTGNFYLHPHDLDLNHPEVQNPLINFKRRVGLKTVRQKLERLLQEVEFGVPR